eukprot:scaffold18291_cov121-Isochrysis_galbana.AAC.2
MSRRVAASLELEFLVRVLRAPQPAPTSPAHKAVLRVTSYISASLYLYLWEIGVNVPFHFSHSIFPLIKANLAHTRINNAPRRLLLGSRSSSRHAGLEWRRLIPPAGCRLALELCHGRMLPGPIDHLHRRLRRDEDERAPVCGCGHHLDAQHPQIVHDER